MKSKVTITYQVGALTMVGPDESEWEIVDEFQSVRFALTEAIMRENTGQSVEVLRVLRVENGKAISEESETIYASNKAEYYRLAESVRKALTFETPEAKKRLKALHRSVDKSLEESKKSRQRAKKLGIPF